jgi:peptidoglycan/LPS O-acetylase OafA/YrhL
MNAACLDVPRLMKTSRKKRNHAAWIGPLVALIGLLTYFTVAVRFPDLRDSAIVNLVMVIGGAAIAAWGLLRRRNWKSWIGLGTAVFFASLLFGYVFVLSNQLPSADTAVAIGSAAPPLELPDQTGRVVSLDAFKGERVLVVFYRGFW